MPNPQNQERDYLLQITDLPPEVLCTEVLRKWPELAGSSIVLRLVCRWLRDIIPDDETDNVKAGYIGTNYAELSSDDDRFTFGQIHDSSRLFNQALGTYCVDEQRIDLAHLPNWKHHMFLDIAPPAWWDPHGTFCDMADLLLYRALVTGNAQFVDSYSSEISASGAISLPNLEQYPHLVAAVHRAAIFDYNDDHIELMQRCKQTRKVPITSTLFADARLSCSHAKNMLIYFAKYRNARQFKNCTKVFKEMFPRWKILEIYLKFQPESRNWHCCSYDEHKRNKACNKCSSHHKLLKNAAKYIGLCGDENDAEIFYKAHGIFCDHVNILIVCAAIARNKLVLDYLDLKQFCRDSRIWKKLANYKDFATIYYLSGLVIGE